MTLHRLQRRDVLAAAGIGLLAALLLAWATGRGVGASRDSCNYFHFARVLLRQEQVQDIDGSGPQIVLTHYPPVYPALLAIGGALHIKLLTAARLINLLSFAATVGLFMALVFRLTGSRVRMAIAAILLLTQPAIVGVQFWAVSEPPYLVAQFAAMWLLIEILANTQTPPWCFAAGAGLALAAATFTRYIGGALFPAACVTVLLAPRPARERVIGLAWLVCSFALPVAVLAISQRLLLTSVTHRTIEYHPLTAGHWWNLWSTLQGWFASPEAFGAPATWIASAMVAGCVIFLLPLPLREGAGGGATGPVPIAARSVGNEDFDDKSGTRLGKPRGPLPLPPPARGGGKEFSPAALLAVPAIVIYVALLMVSVAFIDNATPVDDRLLAPAAAMLLLWLVAGVRSPFVFNGWCRGVATATATFIVIAAISSGAIRIARQVGTLRTQGFGFNHIAFRNSTLVKACRAIPQSTPIYSNYPEAIFLHAGHDAAILPGRPTAIGRETGDPMEAAFIRMQNGLKDGGYVAYFGFRAGRNVAAISVKIDELMSRIPLKIDHHTKDGTLLRAIPRPTTQATTQTSATTSTTTAVP